MCGIAGLVTRASTPPREMTGGMREAMRERFEAGIELAGVHIHAA